MKFLCEPQILAIMHILDLSGKYISQGRIHTSERPCKQVYFKVVIPL